MEKVARRMRFLIAAIALVALAAGPAQADGHPPVEPAPAVEPALPLTVDSTAVDPAVSVARHRRCSSRTIVISPTYFGGALLKSVLFVNGRRMQTVVESGRPFKLGVRRFKSGRNNYEVVSIFASGKAASVLGAFKRCSRRR